jgi:aerobic carbon-monoxide dehydrogenase medium subunit
MKSPRFEIARPASVAEAMRLLAEANGAAKAIAGGQSLTPMLNLRLVQPRLLVDITGIPELTRVEESDEAVTIGACIATAAVEDGLLPTRGLEMLSEVARGIAYRAVRNRGTVGGSLCHADPAADWPSALLALDAQCIIAGPGGNRRVALRQFIKSAFEVDMAAGELLEAIRIPRTSPDARWSYEKICRKTGEFAMAIGVVLNDPRRGIWRAVAGATSGRPILVEDAQLLAGSSARGDGPVLDAAAADRLLRESGVHERHARQHHIAALGSAFARAMAP